MRLCWIGLVLFALALALKAVWPAETVMLQQDFDQLGDRYVLLPAPGDLRILDVQPVKAEIRVNHPLRWHGWWIYAAGENGYVAIRDRFWPIAALGGLLMLLGAAWRCVCPKR